MHRTNGLTPLIDHRLGRSSPFGKVAAETANEADIRVGIDEESDRSNTRTAGTARIRMPSSRTTGLGLDPVDLSVRMWRPES